MFSLQWRPVALLLAVGAVALQGVVATSHRATEQKQPSLRPAISGTVTDRSTHAPIVNANVALRAIGDAQIPLAKRTDQVGRFVFVGLASGNYSISTMASGYADGHFGLGLSGTTIALEEQGWFSKADIEMEKLGSITGQVLDDLGQPVVDAFVRVLAVISLSGRKMLATGPVGKTDDRGNYRIAYLPVGKYFVTVPSIQHTVPVSPGVAGQTDPSSARTGAAQPPNVARHLLLRGQNALVVGDYPVPPLGRSELVFPTTFYPGSMTPAGAAPVEVGRAADVVGIDFRLRPVPTFRVSGRIGGSTQVSPGMMLRLIQDGMEELGLGSEVATTFVTLDGSFAFLNVPVGNYLLVSPGSTFEFALSRPVSGSRPVLLSDTPGLQNLGSRLYGARLSSAPGVEYNSTGIARGTADQSGYVRVSVAVGAGDLSGLTIVTQPTAVIRCKLVDDATAAAAKPRGYIEVAAADANPSVGAHSYGVTGSSADEAIVMPALLPGKYTVRTNLAGFSIESITLDGADVTRGVFTLRSGQDAQMVVKVTQRSIVLSGFVTDDRGQRLTAGGVMLFPTDRRLWTDYGFIPTWIRTAVAATNGSYRLQGIRAGEYYVIGVDESHLDGWIDVRFLDSAAAKAEKLTLNWGDVVNKVVITGLK